MCLGIAQRLGLGLEASDYNNHVTFTTCNWLEFTCARAHHPSCLDHPLRNEKRGSFCFMTAAYACDISHGLCRYFQDSMQRNKSRKKSETTWQGSNRTWRSVLEFAVGRCPGESSALPRWRGHGNQQWRQETQTGHPQRHRGWRRQWRA